MKTAEELFNEYCNVKDQAVYKTWFIKALIEHEKQVRIDENQRWLKHQGRPQWDDFRERIKELELKGEYKHSPN